MAMLNTVVCRIVRRLLISVHKWQFPGWPPWILIPTLCPPSIFINFSLAKSHNFFIMQKSKFTEIFNICWKHVPFILCRGSHFSTNVVYFCEFWFLHYEKIMRFSSWKIGEYTRWAQIWDQYSWLSATPGNCYLWTEISKRGTIMQATVFTDFTVHFLYYSRGVLLISWRPKSKSYLTLSL